MSKVITNRLKDLTDKMVGKIKSTFTVRCLIIERTMRMLWKNCWFIKGDSAIVNNDPGIFSLGLGIMQCYNLMFTKFSCCRGA